MNKVLLIGRLTKDLELSKTQNGKSYAKFTLAVNRRTKSEQGKQDADFISCVVWDKRAETMYQYLGKGSQVGIEGRIQTGSYERDGRKVYTTDVIVENFDFLESRNSSQNQTEQFQDDVNQYVAPTLDIANDDLPF